MQPQLTTPEGNIIPLTEDVYEAILQLLKDERDHIEPANSVEELEIEFSDLFADSPSTSDLLAEHTDELPRENRILQNF